MPKKKTMQIKCPRCNGTGLLYRGGVGSVTCSVCMGIGTIQVNKPVGIKPKGQR